MYDSMQSSPQIIKSAHFKVQSLQVSLFVYVDHKYPFFVTKWWPKTKQTYSLANVQETIVVLYLVRLSL